MKHSSPLTRKSPSESASASASSAHLAAASAVCRSHWHISASSNPSAPLRCWNRPRRARRSRGVVDALPWKVDPPIALVFLTRRQPLARFLRSRRTERFARHRPDVRARVVLRHLGRRGVVRLGEHAQQEALLLLCERRSTVVHKRERDTLRATSRGIVIGGLLARYGVRRRVRGVSAKVRLERSKRVFRLRG